MTASSPGSRSPGPPALSAAPFRRNPVISGETVFFTPNGTARFAARCLTANSTELPATCLRDIRIGRTLSLLYRFNRAYLRDWQAMDQATRALGKRLVIDNQ